MLHDVIPNAYKHVHCVATKNKIITDRRYIDILINKLYLSNFYVFYLFKPYKLLPNTYVLSYLQAVQFITEVNETLKFRI